MESSSRVKLAQAWAVQGWVTSWEECTGMEKNARDENAQAWPVQG